MNKLFFPFSSDKYNLETKWWHRLLKILYFLVSIIILILSFFIIKEGFGNNLGNFNDSILGYNEKIYQYLTEEEEQNKFLSKIKVKYILDNSSKDSNKEDIIDFLVDKGFKLEGLNDTSENQKIYDEGIQYGRKNKFLEMDRGFAYNFLFYSEITILTILSYLIINFIIQLFYYKGILYIVYGNNKS